MKYIRPLIILVVLTLFATSANALVTTYKNPTTGPGGDSHEILPITIGPINDVKDGGLTIGGSFLARDNALLQGNTYIQGLVRGSNPQNWDSTVAFGTAPSTTVHVDASGSMTAEGKLQTDSLSAGGHVCADINGTLIICTPEPVTCPVGQVPNPNGTGCISAPCVANVKFHGGFRWGWVEYIAPAPANHPGLTITVTLEGLGNGTQPDGDPRDVIFTMPSNSPISYTNGQSCAPGAGAGNGCEIEGVNGFAFGYTSHVTPQYIPGGKICVDHD